ncbi:hypothetical protein GCM10017774_87050 [Lentzea cavernae]|uniref:Coenzyme PQQ synthesis protein D (PqqD) n=1 Tax=Lentzea cavernae TaxID=2020703 RepID=A0ABQ3MTQ8_9PSEU|nr:hypothetical protein GCM10017774_87050 [Lentzea cavernae]
MKAAGNVTVTMLPFGGAVLVNGTTLAVAECTDAEAEVIALVLGGEPVPDRAAPFVAQLVEAGWFVASDREV